MRRILVRFSGLEPSNHSQSSADSVTITSGCRSDPLCVVALGRLDAFCRRRARRNRLQSHRARDPSECSQPQKHALRRFGRGRFILLIWRSPYRSSDFWNGLSDIGRRRRLASASQRTLSFCTSSRRIISGAPEQSCCAGSTPLVISR